MLKQVNADTAISFLNNLLAIDPMWVNSIMNSRHICKKELGDTDVQILELEGGHPAAGALGLINGLFGTLGVGERKDWGPIIAFFDEKDVIIKFGRTPL